jgi:hypothetical protein
VQLGMASGVPGAGRKGIATAWERAARGLQQRLTLLQRSLIKYLGFVGFGKKLKIPLKDPQVRGAARGCRRVLKGPNTLAHGAGSACHLHPL